MMVAPNLNVVRGGVLIGTTTNLGSGLGGISTGWNLNRSLILPKVTTRVVRTPQMVFTNPIMTTHVSMTSNRPLMNSIIARRYIKTNVGNLGGYQKPSIVIAGILNHRNGHSMRPNKVALWP